MRLSTRMSTPMIHKPVCGCKIDGPAFRRKRKRNSASTNKGKCTIDPLVLLQCTMRPKMRGARGECFHIAVNFHVAFPTIETGGAPCLTRHIIEPRLCEKYKFKHITLRPCRQAGRESCGTKIHTANTQFRKTTLCCVRDALGSLNHLGCGAAKYANLVPSALAGALHAKPWGVGCKFPCVSFRARVPCNSLGLSYSKLSRNTRFATSTPKIISSFGGPGDVCARPKRLPRPSYSGYSPRVAM